jgi:DNA-binding transcriptional regulator YdaS (Cro superfamily)
MTPDEVRRTRQSVSRMTKVRKDRGLNEAIKRAGGIRALARKLGIDHTAVLRWNRVPYERILEIEKETGVPRETLRPELYRERKGSESRSCSCTLKIRPGNPSL